MESTPMVPGRWAALWAALAAQITVSVVAQGTPVIAPFVQTEFSLTRAQIGLLSSAVTFGAGTMLAVAGWAVDKYGERSVMVMASLAAGTFGIVSANAPDYYVILVGLMGVGWGAAGVTPAGSKVVLRWFSAAQRAMAMGFRQTGVPLGGALAAAVLPAVVVSYGWRAGLTTASVLALMGGAVFLFIDARLKHPAGGQVRIKRRSGGQGRILTRPVWLLGLAGAMLPFGQFCLVSYLALFLFETRGVSLALGSLMLVGAAVAGAVGRVALGMVSDRLFDGRRVPVVALAGFSAGILVLALGTLAARIPLIGVALIAMLIGFFAYGWNSVWLTLVSESSVPGRQGSTIGLSLTMMQVGVVAAPPAFGWLVDWLASWAVAWSVLTVILFAGAGLVLAVPEGKEGAHAAAAHS